MALTQVPIELSSTPGIVDNSNATAITIDSSENVGIGSTPISLDGNAAPGLTVSSNGPFILLQDANNADKVIYISNNTGELQFGIVGDNGTTGKTEHMRLDTSGNLLVGKTSANFNSSGRGNVEIGGTGSAILALSAGSDNAYIYNSGSELDILAPTGQAMRFFTNGVNERMRIDSSGNLMVGTTDTAPGVTDTNEGFAINSSRVFVSRASDYSLSLNRTTDDGAIAIFRKDGTSVGSIGSGTGIHFAGASCGLRMHSGGTKIFPTNGSGTALNNTVSLGAEGARWTQVYATNGTINTSDRNEKQDIATLSDAEQRVAVACKGLLRKFRWIDAVEAKGDDARIHFGIIAQDLQTAFEAEGLDAGRYGMFINTTWTDEETEEEHTSLGVRYSELLAFIISAI